MAKKPIALSYTNTMFPYIVYMTQIREYHVLELQIETKVNDLRSL